MPRRAAKIDRNQPEIVEFFRKSGCSVSITSAVGDGFPDLVVGFGGITVLVEVKDGEQVPSKQKLTEDQVIFFDEFKGAKTVVNSIKDAAKLVALLKEMSAMVKVNWMKKFIESC